MFGNIKRKLNDVIQEGLPTNYLKTNSTSSDNLNNIEIGIPMPSNINISAGCQILRKNEEIWKNIHSINEKNANLARKIDEQIKKIKNNSDKLYTNFTDLNYLLSQMPTIEKNLNNCINTIQTINEKCKIIDEKLINLEDLCEEIKLQEKQLEHKVQLSKYKQEKMKQLEEVRLKLAVQYEEKLKKHEESLIKIQKERQAVFQDAFEHDIELFKEKGELPKVERIKRELSNELSLEEIDLNSTDDQNNLENF